MKSANCSSTTGRSPMPGRSDRCADEAFLRDWRVHDPCVAELLEQSLRDAEGTAEMTDVLAEEEHVLVVAKRIDERGPHRFEVRDLAAHSVEFRRVGAFRHRFDTTSSRYANKPRILPRYDRLGRRRGVAPGAGAKMKSYDAIPPSTSRSAPVMYDASRDARKRTGAMTSAIVPRRRNGVSSTISERSRSTARRPSVMSVST